MEVSPEEQLLLSVVGKNPTKEQLAETDQLLSGIKDWGSLIQLLIQHGSAPLFYQKLALLKNNSSIPVEQKALLKQVYYRTLTRSALLYNALTQIIEILQNKGIRVIVLKGGYLCQELYKDIALRQFSDLDLLVREEDGVKTLQLLEELGYHAQDPGVSAFISSQTEIVHYAPMVKDGVSVEVHIRLHKKNSSYAIRTEKLFEDTISFQLNTTKAEALSLYDLLIHLCIHIDKHFNGGQIQMKCFNDVVNLLEVYKNEIDWQELVLRCRIHSAEVAVFKQLLLTAEFYTIALPEEIVNNYQGVVQEADRSKFLDYLYCRYDNKYHVNTHWENIRKINHLGRQIRYLVELIFPPKAFMISKYLQSKEPRAKNQESRLKMLKLKFWWLWYPYRWFVGLKGVVRLIMKSQEPRY